MRRRSRSKILALTIISLVIETTHHAVFPFNRTFTFVTQMWHPPNFGWRRLDSQLPDGSSVSNQVELATPHATMRPWPHARSSGSRTSQRQKAQMLGSPSLANAAIWASLCAGICSSVLTDRLENRVSKLEGGPQDGPVIIWPSHPILPV